jgi:hypothetical protein
MPNTVITRIISSESHPNGICPAKLTRKIKQQLNLPIKPKCIYAGKLIPGSDNIISGELELRFSLELTAQQILDVDSVFTTVNPCKDNHATAKPDFGVDLDDLDDLLSPAQPGQTVFVRDLARASGDGSGCMVYRSEDSWRRVSDDLKVWP